jgi:hypothetical protein
MPEVEATASSGRVREWRVECSRPGGKSHKYIKVFMYPILVKVVYIKKFLWYLVSLVMAFHTSVKTICSKTLQHVKMATALSSIYSIFIKMCCNTQEY